MALDLGISIVLFKNEISSLQSVIASVLNNRLNFHLFLIDNSPDERLKSGLKKILTDKRVSYIHCKKNVGYGKAHNIALNKSVHEALYHLVLNPDIEFEQGVLENIFAFMQSHQDVGQLLPKVFYKNGELQKLCNPLPKPVNLMGRRFFLQTHWAKKINDEYELKGFDYDYCLNAPNLSGCFMFLRCDVLKKTGLFDKRYFMYMEDVDLCRRIHAVSKTLFYPEVSIIHGFEKESYSNKKLLRHHMASAIKYFNKWGWMFDKQRDKFNEQLLEELSDYNKVAAVN